MHVLIISRSYPNKINQSSGNFVKNQVEALSQHKVQIGILGVYGISIKKIFDFKSLKHLGIGIEKQKNIFHYFNLLMVLPKLSFLTNRIKFILAKHLFKKYIKEHALPDLIHLHTFELGLLALWAEKKYNIPYVVTEHTSAFQTGIALSWHKKLAQKVYASSCYNISVSQATSEDLFQRFGTDFNYLPNFVDTSKFSINTKSNNVITFINVAYLNKNKNHELLIQAFSQNFRNNTKYKLQIIGNGPEMDNLKQLCHKEQINNVEFLAYQNQEEVSKYLGLADYFVLSSKSETFGLVLIEAMSCGLPVISTRCGGPESIVTDSQLGILCDNNNLDALAKAMVEITKISYSSAYIRSYAIENFSFEFLSEKLINIYSSLMQ